MKCDSFLPYQFKFNLISCLIKRAFKIGSEETAFNAELSYLQKYFTQNNFPANLVSKMFQKVIHKIYNPNVSAEKTPVYFLSPLFGQCKSRNQTIIKMNHFSLSPSHSA